MQKLTVILLLFTAAKLSAQPEPVFQHLNTANGLSYSVVNDVCTDAKGALWIATGNGLNRFNGKTVDKYFASDYPQLQNSNVLHVTCDGANRVWVLTAGGNVTMVDENRQLHRVGFYADDSFVRTRWILNTAQGIILLTEKGHYVYNKQGPGQTDSLSASAFSFLPIRGFDTLVAKRQRQVFRFDENNYLLVADDCLFKVDYRSRSVQKFGLADCIALIRWNENSLLYYDKKNGETKAFDFRNGQTFFPFRHLTDQYGEEPKAYFVAAEKIGPSRYLFSTFYRGLYVYDAQANKLFRYRHSVADPSTVASDLGSSLAVSKSGWAFIVCNPAGISYFNTAEFIGNRPVFTDARGRAFDGYTAGIATADNDRYFIGTANGLLRWQRSTNATTFLKPLDENGGPVFKNEEVRAMAFDNEGRLWCTTNGYGLALINQNGRLLRHLWAGPDNNKYRTAIRFAKSGDGSIWAVTGFGFLHLQNGGAVPLPSALRKLDTVGLSAALFVSPTEMLIGSWHRGLFRYNTTAQTLSEVTAFSPYKTEGIIDLAVDGNGSIYVGNRQGLTVLSVGGGIKRYNSHNGLLVDVVEGLLRDDEGRIWIGNDIGLGCYNPRNGILQTFDERYGLTVYGFRWTCYFKMPNGEFFFGTTKGIQYFHPDSLVRRQLHMNVSVTRVESASLSTNVGANASFALPATDNGVTFLFSSVDFRPHLRTYYRYRLVNADKSWIYVADQTSVRYNSLPPGRYLFQVAISNDNRNWQAADNEVVVDIARPWFKTWWAKSAGLLVSFLLIGFVLNYYRQQQAGRREELETEAVINYFASQINSHQEPDALLWDVAKNCISRLQFEDCVIYLKDAARNVLVQRAAYGPKNPEAHIIGNPIEVPVGQGITGTVAQTGKAELISNTQTDGRYIVDDRRRCSEVAVPMMAGTDVIGVIDSEHSRKNFFTARHLRILQTVAVLCVNQLQKIAAEAEKQSATIELIENKRKAMESRLQSLRLQMKPHFLFNALNSVQQMILANEEMVATEYLSKFSKLLRAILIHSDKETITLKEELDILTLYIELESIRFKQNFHYRITVDEEVDTDEVKIPVLLVQPFVENAIWHGLMNKKGPRTLTIAFAERGDFIRCTVADDGVGRREAAALKRHDGRPHVSRGIQVSEERLRSMKAGDGRTGNIEIIDRFDDDGEPAGTTVQIDFPL